MSDSSVSAALRSPSRMVVIEAPAGCGKTFQGAEYAREVAGQLNRGRVLILTHTHAACDVFASRTRGTKDIIDIRTIDSLIDQIASAYHLSLDLPADIALWARTQKDGYAALSARVAKLLCSTPVIGRALAQRYPIVIFDEHQDATNDQHAIVKAFYDGGAQLRIFGDPMQRIFGSKEYTAIEADNLRWNSLKAQADAFDELDTPHRWSGPSSDLGQWILTARHALRHGNQIDLRGSLPSGLTVIFNENQSPKRGGYQFSKDFRTSIYNATQVDESLLILSSQIKTVQALRASFLRRIPIWEGYVRDKLGALVDEIKNNEGHASDIAQATVAFLHKVTTGFSFSLFSNIFIEEVSDGCVAIRRGKPATLQMLGRMILKEPNHLGVAKMLQCFKELLRIDPAFKTVYIDYYREFMDAVFLGQFSDLDKGLAEITRRRSYMRLAMPDKAISTIHKSKGLESANVIIIPCDKDHFKDSYTDRCVLYVAMSRATKTLTIVVSRQNPSPLVRL